MIIFVKTIAQKILTSGLLTKFFFLHKTLSDIDLTSISQKYLSDKNGSYKKGTWVSRVEVDLKPPVAEVEGTMNEFSHRVLQAEGHERWGEDWESDGHVDEFWDAESLSGLPVDHNDVPEWNMKSLCYTCRDFRGQIIFNHNLKY